MKKLTNDQVQTFIRLEAIAASIKQIDVALAGAESKIARLNSMEADRTADKSPEEALHLRVEIDAAFVDLRESLENLGRDVLEAVPATSAN